MKMVWRHLNGYTGMLLNIYYYTTVQDFCKSRHHTSYTFYWFYLKKEATWPPNYSKYTHDIVCTEPVMYVYWCYKTPTSVKFRKKKTALWKFAVYFISSVLYCFGFVWLKNWLWNVVKSVFYRSDKPFWQNSNIFVPILFWFLILISLFLFSFWFYRFAMEFFDALEYLAEKILYRYASFPF